MANPPVKTPAAKTSAAAPKVAAKPPAAKPPAVESAAEASLDLKQSSDKSIVVVNAGLTASVNTGSAVAMALMDAGIDASEMMADAGLGVETADASSTAIPFISVLQTNSKALISGQLPDSARPTMFHNSITNELWKSLRVVPVYYKRMFIEWVPRDQGGGFKGMHEPADVEGGRIKGLTTNEKGVLITQEGNELKDTRTHFCLVEGGDGNWFPAVISFGSSQIKKSKRWMSMIMGLEIVVNNSAPFNPASFSHVYTVDAVKEENKKGVWFGMSIGRQGPVQSKALYDKAKKFHAAIIKGEVVVQPPQDDDAIDATQSEGDGVPF